MNIFDTIKNTIVDNSTLFGFEYNGKFGNIDPCYKPNLGDTFLLFFDGREKTVCSFDEVMNEPFFSGKSLSEIANYITITDA
ncbi:MAG: hypothetical protein RR576_06930 [Oscillospiraceae bacterium]